MTITILYNPKCGTCRQVREAIEAKGFMPKIVEYLKNPPSVEELDSICRKLGVEPQAIAREKEPIYTAIAAKKLDRAGWLKALHDNPILIQRPIVVSDDHALVVRPAEKIEEFFKR